MHASESVLVIGELLCTGVQANAERHTRNETREMYSCWGYKQQSVQGLSFGVGGSKVQGWEVQGSNEAHGSKLTVQSSRVGSSE